MYKIWREEDRRLKNSANFYYSQIPSLFSNQARYPFYISSKLTSLYRVCSVSRHLSLAHQHIPQTFAKFPIKMQNVPSRAKIVSVEYLRRNFRLHQRFVSTKIPHVPEHQIRKQTHINTYTHTWWNPINTYVYLSQTSLPSSFPNISR